MRHENRRLRAVLIGGWYVDRDLSLFAHWLPWVKRGIIAPKDLAVSQTHRELKGLSLLITPIRQVRINLVVGTDCYIPIAFRARFLGVTFVGQRRANDSDRQETEKADDQELWFEKHSANHSLKMRLVCRAGRGAADDAGLGRVLCFNDGMAVVPFDGLFAAGLLKQICSGGEVAIRGSSRLSWRKLFGCDH
jgi:hypothetical protein